MGKKVVRLQCFEGIDASSAIYDWNYPRQILAIRQMEGQSIDLYSDKFLMQRPLLEVLRDPVNSLLLIDEIDRSDHEFEAYLLEFLSDFTISIPELGTERAIQAPILSLIHI